MIKTGRRPIAGLERAPSGRISRSRATMAEREARANAMSAREARQGRSLQARTQDARGAYYGLSPKQAASQHASSVEGRLHLRGIITETQLEAARRYKRDLDRFGRDWGAPRSGQGILAKMQPSGSIGGMPRPGGASAALSLDRHDRLEEALAVAGRDATWAVGCVIRQEQELPESFHRAIARGLAALANYYGLEEDVEPPAVVA